MEQDHGMLASTAGINKGLDEAIKQLSQTRKGEAFLLIPESIIV